MIRLDLNARGVASEPCNIAVVSIYEDGCLRNYMRGGSVKCFGGYSFCMGPRLSKASFLETRDLSSG